LVREVREEVAEEAVGGGGEAPVMFWYLLCFFFFFLGGGDAGRGVEEEEEQEENVAITKSFAGRGTERSTEVEVLPDPERGRFGMAEGNCMN